MIKNEARNFINTDRSKASNIGRSVENCVMWRVKYSRMEESSFFSPIFPNLCVLNTFIDGITTKRL